MKKIYIAGPDVFELDSIEIGKRYKQQCLDYGFTGLYPLDNEADFSQEPNDIAKEIFEANKQMIIDCDIVIANLNPFRGKEADSGTVWECGFASALGKEVYVYLKDTSEYIDKFTPDEKFTTETSNEVLDSNLRVIENFGLPMNLMIACSANRVV